MWIGFLLYIYIHRHFWIKKRHSNTLRHNTSWRTSSSPTHQRETKIQKPEEKKKTRSSKFPFLDQGGKKPLPLSCKFTVNNLHKFLTHTAFLCCDYYTTKNKTLTKKPISQYTWCGLYREAFKLMHKWWIFPPRWCHKSSFQPGWLWPQTRSQGTTSSQSKEGLKPWQFFLSCYSCKNSRMNFQRPVPQHQDQEGWARVCRVAFPNPTFLFFISFNLFVS